MYNLTFSGTQVLLGGGLLVLCLSVLFFVFKYYSNQENASVNAESNRTKYLSADIFRHRSTLLRVGLISSLAFTLMAFNWTQYDYSNILNGTIEIEDFEIENTIPITSHPPPPPPPPLPPPTIEVLEDDKIKESETFESMDVNANEAVIPTVFTPKPAPNIPPPPPIIESNIPPIFKIVERMPVFGPCAGGADEASRRECSSRALIEFIGKHIRYPALASEVSIQGTVVIRFIVEPNGSMSNLEIIRDMGGGLGDEALRVARLMAETGDWTSGKQRGKPVRVQFNLPVKFKLQ